MSIKVPVKVKPAQPKVGIYNLGRSSGMTYGKYTAIPTCTVVVPAPKKLLEIDITRRMLGETPIIEVVAIRNAKSLSELPDAYVYSGKDFCFESSTGVITVIPKGDWGIKYFIKVGSICEETWWEEVVVPTLRRCGENLVACYWKDKTPKVETITI